MDVVRYRAEVSRDDVIRQRSFLACILQQNSSHFNAACPDVADTKTRKRSVGTYAIADGAGEVLDDVPTIVEG